MLYTHTYGILLFGVFRVNITHRGVSVFCWCGVRWCVDVASWRVVTFSSVLGVLMFTSKFLCKTFLGIQKAQFFSKFINVTKSGTLIILE